MSNRKRSKRRNRYGRIRRWVRQRWKRHGTISVENIGESTTIRNRKLPYPLKWDSWEAFYCEPKHGRTRKFNENYFYLALTMCIAQGTYFHLVSLMLKHGGCAFFLIVLLAYISVGYPLLVMETMISQYSGRKPLRMLRYMCPALSGIGPAWYMRAFAQGLNSLGMFIYAVYFAWDLFFCTPWENNILNMVVSVEKDHKMYTFFELLDQAPAYSDDNGELADLNYSFWTLFIFIIYMLVLMTSIKEIGLALTKIVKILYLGLIGYLIIICLRVGGGSSDSLMFLPLRMLLNTKWSSLLSGEAWVDAIYHVLRSLALGTLVHPYLGSKSFFHYNTQRDGIWLIVCTFIWNATFAVAALLWLGYVGVDRKQIKLAMTNLEGNYGIFIVFFLKHFQAEMSSSVESDILFFNGCFVAINGILNLTATVIYLYMVTDCLYTDQGMLTHKIGIHILFAIIWCIIFPTLILSEDGFRHLIFFEFYSNRSATVLFIMTCFFGAVVYGVNITKFMFDLVNMTHYKGLQVQRINVHIVKIACGIFMLFMTVAILSTLFERPYPDQGNSIWNNTTNMYIGNTISILPVISVAAFAVYYVYQDMIHKNKRFKCFRPHRDWFKNKYHVQVCFPARHTQEKADRHVHGDTTSDTDSLDVDTNR